MLTLQNICDMCGDTTRVPHKKNVTSKAPGQHPDSCRGHHRLAYSNQPQVGIRRPIRVIASIEGTRSQEKLREDMPVETQQRVSQDVQRRCSVFQTTLHNKANTSHQKWLVNFIKGATPKASAVNRNNQSRECKTDQHDQCIQHDQCNSTCA
jgi:hypothetical protein